MNQTKFGTLADGTQIHEVSLAAGGLSVSILSFGAVVRDVRLAGVEHPLVLGFDRLADYVEHSPYFGAVVGRSANRIAQGRFMLDGRPVQLSQNENAQTHLHGGFRGFGTRPWQLLRSDARSAVLAIRSSDGEEGYPGQVQVTLHYSVEPPSSLRMEIQASCDAPTLLNLAHHSYFNLDDSPDILDHRLCIFADEYTPSDAHKIPTGEIASVAGTDYDFRHIRPIRLMRGGARIAYDLNYIVAGATSASPRQVVRFESPRSRIALDVFSTEPGLQLYDGSLLNVPVPGLGGRWYRPSSGCCFEPQAFPDAPNHPNFPSSILRPGQTYRQTSIYTFSRF